MHMSLSKTLEETSMASNFLSFFKLRFVDRELFPPRKLQKIGKPARNIHYTLIETGRLLSFVMVHLEVLLRWSLFDTYRAHKGRKRIRLRNEVEFL